MHDGEAVDFRIRLAPKNHGYSVSAQSYNFGPRLRKLDILDFTLYLMHNIMWNLHLLKYNCLSLRVFHVS